MNIYIIQSKGSIIPYLLLNKVSSFHKITNNEYYYWNTASLCIIGPIKLTYFNKYPTSNEPRQPTCLKQPIYYRSFQKTDEDDTTSEEEKMHPDWFSQSSPRLNGLILSVLGANLTTETSEMRNTITQASYSTALDSNSR